MSFNIREYLKAKEKQNNQPVVLIDPRPQPPKEPDPDPQPIKPPKKSKKEVLNVDEYGETQEEMLFNIIKEKPNIATVRKVLKNYADIIIDRDE
jgi:hypothetical protein